MGGAACGLVTLAGDKIGCCAAARLARFVRLCDAFSLPLITFVDAAGFECLQGAAKLSHAYAEATTAKLTVVTGRAYGPGVHCGGRQIGWRRRGAGLALGGDFAAAPETAVHILWQDKLAAMTDPTKERPALAEEYAETACSPLAAAADGFVTDVIPPAETKASWWL